MSNDIDLKSLHPLEVRVLREFDPGDTISADVLAERLGYKTGQANQAVSWLGAKGLVEETERETVVAYELTDLGREYAEKGTPEERIVRFIDAHGPARIPEIVEALGLANKDVGSAYGALSKMGVLAMDGEKRITLRDADAADEVKKVRALLDKAAASEDGVLTQ
ncbi:MAG: phenylalanine--tRNA ligase subunit alpha, partial [bacterium]